MGFLATDLTVLSSTGPTTNIPVSKDVNVKAFTVARTETSAGLKVVLPADASSIGLRVFGGTASDAGTTATLTFTASSGGSTISSGTYNAKTNGAVTGEVTMSGLPNLQPVPLVGDITLTAYYGETGTASTTGGPWNCLVTYIR